MLSCSVGEQFSVDRRVLVTGGSGFIGSVVCDRLCDAGADVMSVDLVGSRRDRALMYCARVCDVRSDRFADLVGEFAPHVVVHLAAQVDVPVALRQPAKDAEVNVCGTIAVAEAAATVGTELMVFAGSCAIYGAVIDPLVGEDHPLEPRSPYGMSKAAALGYVEWFADQGRLPATSLILGNVYGPGRSPDRGGVISRFLADSAAGRASVLHGNGFPTRDYVHVDDVASAVVHACLAAPAGRVNIGSGVETSVTAIHSMISHITGTQKPPMPVDALPGGIERMCLRIDKAATALDWTPQVDLSEGIAALAATGTGANV